MSRTSARILVSLATLIVGLKAFRFFANFQEAELWGLFNGDVSESSQVPAAIQWWCKVLKAAQ